MAKGSPRIVVRIPEPLLELLNETVEARNTADRQDRHWSRTEYVVQAIVDKLNHDRRSRGQPGTLKQAAVDDGFPREFWGD